MSKTQIFLLSLFLLLANAPSIYAAGTLKDAMQEALLYNPSLAAAQASLRANAQSIPKARANLLPQINASASSSSSESERYSFDDDGVKGLSTPESKRENYSISARQSIFAGGKNLNSLRRTKIIYEQKKAEFLNTQQQFLLSVVRSYMDVIHARYRLELSQSHLKGLLSQLETTSDRFELGELTRTDLAQSQSRVFLARSSLASAQQGVITAEAEYLRIIGVAPNNIEAPTNLPELPNSKEEALKIARTENPSFLAARLAEKASKYGVKIASASFLPSVSLSAARTKSKSNPVNAYDTDEQSDSISAMLTIPLFAGGRNKASLREAKEINAQRKLEIHNASRLLERQLVSAWYELESTKERLRFLKEQVKATKSALDGVVAETEIGLRNISDVLDAEEEVLDSELDLLLVQRDQFIASYTLLAIMGKLTPKRLGLQSPENW